MADWLQVLLATIVISLQTWILLEIIKLKVSQTRSDVQLGRIVSDIESEKGTRKRLHDDFETRLRTLEHARH